MALSGRVSIAVKSGATVAEAAKDIAGWGAWETVSQEWATNPDDSEAWEWADIDALQIGVHLTDTGVLDTNVRCTQVYVVVDYTEGLHLGVATFSGTGTLATKGESIFSAKAILSGIGTLIAKGQRMLLGKAALMGSGALDATATIITFGEVEIAYTTDPLAGYPDWANVEDDCIAIHTKRGRQHELDRFEAGEATIILNNSSGNYWPDNASSAYYPNVKIGKKVRIRRLYGGTYHDLFTGFIESYRPGWLSKGGKGPIMTIHCVDYTKILSRSHITDGTGYSQELSGTRIGNVLDSVSWPAGFRDIDTGQQNMIVSGALSNENAFTHIQKVCESEVSLLYVTAGGYTQYEDRSHRTNSPHDASVATFGDDAGEMPYTEVDFALDDKLLYNDIRLTREGGAEQTATNATSVTAYGNRSLIRTGLLLTSDAVIEDYCVLLLARYSDIATRVRSITINPQDDPANLWPKALGYEISTRIKVRLNDASINDDYFIEGIEHNYDARDGLWTTKWALSDASRYLYTPDARDETLRPDSAGAECNISNEFGCSACPNHYDCVYEADTDEDTTYIRAQDAVVWKRDLYNLSNSTGFGTINKITLYFRVYGHNADDRVKGAIKSDTTASETAEKAPVSDFGYHVWGTYSEDWATDPHTSLGWTWAALDALQAGVNLKPGVAENLLCTQVYVVVNYTPTW